MKQTTASKRLLIFRLIILALGVSITVFVYQFVTWQQKQQALNEMHIVAQQRNINLANHITSRIGIMDSLAAVMQPSNQVKPDIFDKQTDIYFRQYTDIQAIYWSPYTTASQINQLAQKAKGLGINNFRIYSPEELTDESNKTKGKKHVKPATEENFYLPTLFKKQRYQSMPPAGMDILNSPQWRDQILKAIESRHISTARTMTLIEDKKRSKVLWLFYPVFKSEKNSVPEGVISMNISFDDFIENAISTLSTTPVPIEIYDLTDHSKIPLYHWPEKQLFNGLNNEFESSSSLLPFFDKDLKIINVATKHYLQKYQNDLPLWLAALSLICTGLVYIAIKMTQFRTEQLHEESNQRCWQLEQSNKTLNNKVIEKSTFERAHRDIQDRLNDYLALSEDYFWELDSELKYSFVSRKCVNVTGYPANSLIGSSIMDTLVEEDLENFQQLIDRITQKRQPMSIEVRCWAKGNRYRLERIHIVPIVEKNGEIFGFRGISRDISNKLHITDDAIDESPIVSQAFSGNKLNEIPLSITAVEDQSHPDSTYKAFVNNFLSEHEKTLDLVQQAFVKDKYTIILPLMRKLREDADKIGSESICAAASDVAQAVSENQPASIIEEKIELLDKHLAPVIQNMKSVSA